MKKIISIAMLAAAVVLSSCSKQDDWQPTDDTVRVTINTQVPQTRAAARAEATKPTRFIIEVYEGDAITTAPIKRIEQDNGRFTLILEKNTTYCFLYWADNATPAEKYYDASDLQAVTVIDNTLPGQVAYFGATPATLITSSGSSIDVTLRHAVAQLVYRNILAFTSTTGNSLQVTYPRSEAFDASTGQITVTDDTEVVRTFAIADAEDEHATVGVIATDYIFAPLDESRLATLKVTTTIGGVAEAPREVTNVPIRRNYITRIAGAFSNLYNTSFSVSTSVDNMEEQDQPL